MTPSAQMSACGPTSLGVRICSGDMYRGEPTRPRVLVSDPEASLACVGHLEMPNRHLDRELAVRAANAEEFADLRSRWMMPRAWASATATHA